MRDTLFGGVQIQWKTLRERTQFSTLGETAEEHDGHRPEISQTVMLIITIAIARVHWVHSI